MALKVTDAGGLAILSILFAATAKPTTFTVRLITDSTALADADINTTHTVAVGGGYADKTLSNNATVSAVGGIPTAVWGDLTWTFTGALTTNPNITGYQVLNGTTLLFEEFFASPMTPATNGDQLVVTIKFQGGNGTPA